MNELCYNKFDFETVLFNFWGTVIFCNYVYHYKKAFRNLTAAKFFSLSIFKQSVKFFEARLKIFDDIF